MSRKLSVIAGLMLFAASLFLSWYLINFQGEENDSVAEPEPAAVQLMEYAPTSVRSIVGFTGRTVPYEQYEMYSEVTGIFEQGDHPFKTGTAFNRGDILIRVNDQEERQELQSARHEFAALVTQLLPDINIDYPDFYNEWINYLNEFDASEKLSPLPDVEDRQFRMFLNRRNVYSRFFSIRRQEVRLDKFTITAPYNGVVTEHRMNPGALVQNGQRLGQFTGIDQLEIEASVPATEARHISVGDSVTLHTTGLDPQTYHAVVSRKNALVTPGTQSVQIFIDVSGADNITPGDYLRGEVLGREFPSAFKIHKHILIRDRELFVAENGRAKMRTVNLLASAGDSMIVSGLNEGDLVINEFRNAAFTDTRVTGREDL